MLINRNEKTIKPLLRPGLGGLLAVLLGLLLQQPAGADTIFVANTSAGMIGEYTTAGALVNASLISGLSG